MQHSVEKIGGTSMSQYQDVMENIWLRPRSVAGQASSLYHRIFVVSAYSGITNGLLEHKKSGEPGVYALFAEMDEQRPWQDKLARVLDDMLTINAAMFGPEALNNPMLNKRADQFIQNRQRRRSQSH